MAIRIKVARSAEELDNVFWLRHQVYVAEDKKFGDRGFPDQRISDRFDALPGVANIIAYDEDEPVGTIRVNLDSSVGLPSEKYFNFHPARLEVRKAVKKVKNKPIFVSAGMLAVRKNWMRRSNVIYALLKTATGILHSWGATHLIATVNHDTISMYGRLGFEALGEPRWVESIGNHVVPMIAEFKKTYEWAFGGLLDEESESFWLNTFSDCFERLLLPPGVQLFEEGMETDYAYIIDQGEVSISRRDSDGKELTLATLCKGELFGELSLLDGEPRSAGAITKSKVELIRLSRGDFSAAIDDDPRLLHRLVRLLVKRIRHTDELALVMAYAPQADRVKFALNKLRKSAIIDRKRPSAKLVRLGPSELAKTAGVREKEVRSVLEMERMEGHLEYGEKVIRFLG